jgi:hypothetical protein
LKANLITFRDMLEMSAIGLSGWLSIDVLTEPSMTGGSGVTL